MHWCALWACLKWEGAASVNDKAKKIAAIGRDNTRQGVGITASSCAAGALLLNLGSLMTRWTNGLWKSTMHQVTNPLPHKAHSSRRLSMAFFHKPNYDAVLEVLPTCYQSSLQQQQGLESEGNENMVLSWQQQPQQQHLLPLNPLYPTVTIGDITRQGILHKYRHLPSEQASQKYHEELLAMRHKE